MESNKIYGRYQKAKDTLKGIAITYLVVGGIYGYAMHSLGVALGKDQPHAILWRKLVGPTLEDVILDALEKN